MLRDAATPSPAPFLPALPRTNEEQSQEALINHSPPLPGWFRRMPGASWSSQTQFAAAGEARGGTEIAASEAGKNLGIRPGALTSEFSPKGKVASSSLRHSSKDSAV